MFTEKFVALFALHWREWEVQAHDALDFFNHLSLKLIGNHRHFNIKGWNWFGTHNLFDCFIRDQKLKLLGSFAVNNFVTASGSLVLLNVWWLQSWRGWSFSCLNIMWLLLDKLLRWLWHLITCLSSIGADVATSLHSTNSVSRSHHAIRIRLRISGIHIDWLRSHWNSRSVKLLLELALLNSILLLVRLVITVSFLGVVHFSFKSIKIFKLFP